MSTITHAHAVLEVIQPRRQALRQRLSALRWQVRRRLLLAGLARGAATAFALAALSLAADWWFRFAVSVRICLLALFAAVLVTAIWRYIIRPLRARLDDLDLAVIFDRRSPGVAQRVAAVLQLPRLLEGTVSASPAMVQAAVLEHAAELDRTDLAKVFDQRAPRRWTAVLVGSLIVAGGFAAARPDIAGLWVRRWLLASPERWPQRSYLSIVGLGSGSRLLVPRGEPLPIQVDSSPQMVGEPGAWRVEGRGEPLVLATIERPELHVPDQVHIRYAGESGPTRHGNFTMVREGLFRYELPPIAEPTKISIAGGDDWFGPVDVEPVDRPVVESLVIIARRPGQTTSETHTPQGADSQLLFLPRTRLELRLVSSVPLASARLVAESGPVPRLDATGGRRYRARWTMRQSQTLEIRLVSRTGRLGSKPYFLSVGLLSDRPPRVTVRSSGVGRRITPQARIPLSIHALEDFGIVALAIETERAVPQNEATQSTSDSAPLTLPPDDAAAPLLDYEAQTTVNVSEMGLAAGTQLKVRATAHDNCADGRQPGSSRWLSFQIVSPEELFYEVLIRQRAERARFTSSVEAAKAQSQELAAEVTREAASAMVRKHQVVARQVWQVANRLDATLQEMTYNELGSPQARDLLNTGVIEPLRNLHNDTLVRLRAALEPLTSTPDSAERLEQARSVQQEAVDSMQRILEQMQQWESFVDVLNQLREVIKLQNAVLESTDAERKKRTSELFDE